LLAVAFAERGGVFCAFSAARKFRPQTLTIPLLSSFFPFATNLSARAARARAPCFAPRRIFLFTYSLDYFAAI